MSASYVRSKTREWVGEVAAATGVPFHETINTASNPADLVWFSVGFNAEFNDGTFCNRGFIETGFISLTIVAAPGEGDGAAVAAVEQIVPAMMAKVDPSGRLAYESWEPIQEDTNGSADRDYRLVAIINYRHTL